MLAEGKVVTHSVFLFPMLPYSTQISMVVTVNNNDTKIEQNTSLEALLKQLDITQTKGMAIAVNARVVSKKDWADTRLDHMDKIMIIKATQGG